MVAKNFHSEATHCAFGTLFKNVKPQPILQANHKLMIHEMKASYERVLFEGNINIMNGGPQLSGSSFGKSKIQEGREEEWQGVPDDEFNWSTGVGVRADEGCRGMR